METKDLLHRHERLLSIPVEFMHPVDILVRDPSGELKLFPESDNGPLIKGKINISEALQPLDCSMCKNATFENRITVCRPLDKHTPS
jgi:hypothetical protein